MNGSILSSSVEHHVSKVGLRCPVTAVEVIELPGLIYVLVGSGNKVSLFNALHDADDPHGDGVDCIDGLKYESSLSESDSVHNIRTYNIINDRVPVSSRGGGSTYFIAAFGGKALLLLELYVLDRVPIISERLRLLQLDDFILDFILPSNDSTTTSYCLERGCRRRAFLGFAHNFVDLIEFDCPTDAAATASPPEVVVVGAVSKQYEYTARFYCSEVSVLFTMTFFPGSSISDIIIASGSVFGKITLWRVCSTGHSDDEYSPMAICEAHQHEGVVFRIRWSNDRCHMLSVSDDRTIRKWKVVIADRCGADGGDVGRIDSDDGAGSGLELLWTGWGHISRLWDAVFVGEKEDEVASCSEDGTIKLWTHTGSCIVTMSGHISHVWRLSKALCGNVLISGGNDASVKLWDLRYHRRASPHEGIGDVRRIGIPQWVTTSRVDKADPTLCDACTDDGGGEGASPPRINSRRLNGVCSISVSPCLSYLVLTLKEGPIWLLLLKTDRWLPVTNLDAVVTMAAVEYVYSREGAVTSSGDDSSIEINIAVALLHGLNVLLFVRTMSQGIEVGGLYKWRAHAMRTINVWFPRRDPPISRMDLVVTATVKGEITVWHWQWQSLKGNCHQQVVITVDAIRSYLTPGSREIVTAMEVIPHSNSCDPFIVAGDSRGTVSIFHLPVSIKSPSTDSASPTGCMEQPLVSFSRIHHTDPVSCIVGHTGGFITVGHDGMLNFFEEIDQRYSFSGVALKWIHAGRLSCLPITTPDRVVFNGGSIDHRGQSLIVCGYHGSIYMAWDLRRSYQLLRVEGGGWKRPHTCVVAAPRRHRITQIAVVRDSNGSNQSAVVEVGDLPGVIFVSPAPTNSNDTVLELYQSTPSLLSFSGRDGNIVDNDDGNEVSLVLRIEEGRSSSSHGRVAYCAALICSHRVYDDDDEVGVAADHPVASVEFVVVGGENSCVKAFSLPDLHLHQELSLSSNSSLKTLSCVCSAMNSSRGVVVGGGGKLQYYVWSYDLSCRDGARRPPLGCLLSTACEGTIWSKATQDHRILSVKCVACVDGYSRRRCTTITSDHSPCEECYYISLCDSRGFLTVALLTHTLSAAIEEEEEEGKDMVRCFCFQVLYEVQASVCPVLSSDLLMISASASGDRSSSVIDYLLVFVGDTAGMVSVWLVRSSSIHTSSSSRSIKLIQLEQYSAHDMGANCISAAIVPSDMQQPCLLHPPEGGTCHHHDRCCCSWHVVVVSGGDDQALTCSQLVVSVSASSADEFEDISCHLYSTHRMDRAASSAFKGLKLIPTAAGGVVDDADHRITCSLRVVTIGYDQRLSVWSISSGITASPHKADYGACSVVSMKTYRFYRSDDAIIRCSESPPWKKKGGSSDVHIIDDVDPFRYLSGAVVNISDVADLDLRLVGGECSGGDGSYVSVVVVGEGFQLLRIDRSIDALPTLSPLKTCPDGGETQTLLLDLVTSP